MFVGPPSRQDLTITFAIKCTMKKGYLMQVQKNKR